MRMRFVLAGVAAGTTAGYPNAIETRGITIAAPPDQVWPWPLQDAERDG